MAVAAVVVALAGCGGDDEPSAPADTTGAQTATAPPPDTATAPSEKEPAKPGRAPEDEGVGLPDGHGGQAAPEDRPGGAGDEIPASVQALFTGRDGKITPAVVRVPPFLAVSVELRSGDGEVYELSARGQTLRTTGESAEPVLFDGLRPGKRLSLAGTGGRVVIEASAEPGP